jgi:hypothetical protein
VTIPRPAGRPGAFPWSGPALLVKFLIPAAVFGFAFGWWVIWPLVQFFSPGGS